MPLTVVAFPACHSCAPLTMKADGMSAVALASKVFHSTTTPTAYITTPPAPALYLAQFGQYSHGMPPKHPSAAKLRTASNINVAIKMNSIPNTTRIQICWRESASRERNTAENINGPTSTQPLSSSSSLMTARITRIKKMAAPTCTTVAQSDDAPSYSGTPAR